MFSLFITIILLVAGIVWFFIGKFKVSEYDKEVKDFTKLSLIPIFIAIIFSVFSSIVILDEKQVGVLTTFGKVSGTRSAGISFKIPFLQKVTKYSTAVEIAKTENEDSATKDLQSVKADIQVNYRVDAKNPRELYKLIQDDKRFKEEIIPSLASEALKATTAFFSIASSNSPEKEKLFIFTF